ncbi:MAG: thioredoxin family protein [Capsulimonadaceae bacterium]
MSEIRPNESGTGDTPLYSVPQPARYDLNGDPLPAGQQDPLMQHPPQMAYGAQQSYTAPPPPTYPPATPPFTNGQYPVPPFGQAYQQYPPRTERPGNGTGLGLIIATVCAAAFFLILMGALRHGKYPTASTRTYSSLPAMTAVANTETLAASQHKNVFVVFHASWCPDCRQFEAFLDLPTVKPIMDSHYTMLWLDEFEHSGSDVPQNSGAQELMDNYGEGKADGIPFFAVIDPEGNVLARGFTRNGDVMGMPTTSDDFDTFIAMIHDTSPGITDDELAMLRRQLEDQSASAIH